MFNGWCKRDIRLLNSGLFTEFLHNQSWYAGCDSQWTNAAHNKVWKDEDVHMFFFLVECWSSGLKERSVVRQRKRTNRAGRLTMNSWKMKDFSKNIWKWVSIHSIFSSTKPSGRNAHGTNVPLYRTHVGHNTFGRECTTRCRKQSGRGEAPLESKLLSSTFLWSCLLCFTRWF